MSALVLILIVLAIIITALFAIIVVYTIGAAAFYAVLKIIGWIADHP